MKPQAQVRAEDEIDATAAAADSDLSSLAASYLDLWERLSAARALIGPDGTDGGAAPESEQGDAG